MTEKKLDDSMSMFNIEVPSGVIDNGKPDPRKAGPARPEVRTPYMRKAESKAQRRAHQKPVYSMKPSPDFQPERAMKIGSALDEASFSEDGILNEIALEPITEADKVQRKSSREMQRRKTKTKGPVQRLATPEARIAEQARKAAMESMPVTEFKMPYVSNKSAAARDLNDGFKAVRQNKQLTKIMSLIIPTHSDGMMEIIRKGLVIICIVVMIFSMGILIKSTRLEKKASKENAGDYFVTKYVYSYDIYKNDNVGKEQ